MSENEQKGPEYPDHVRQYTELRSALGDDLVGEGDASWASLIDVVKKLAGYVGKPPTAPVLGVGEGPLVVYTIIDRERDGKKFWVRIGDGVRVEGGIHVRLDALPTNGTLHVRAMRRGLDGLIEGHREGGWPAGKLTEVGGPVSSGAFQLRAKPAARIVAWLLRKVAELGPATVQHAKHRESLVAGVEALLEESER